MKSIIKIITLALLCQSCEKVIDVKYKDNQATIIIEGNITNVSGAYFVKVSKSIPLSTTTSNPPIDNAIVTISDDAGNNEVLTPQGNGLYKTNVISGIAGRTYTLTVNAESKIYTARSTMPSKVVFDSIKIEKLTFLGETEYDIIPIYTDPIFKGNNYRFVMKINNKLINKHFIQTDEIRNGLVNSFRLDYFDENNVLKVNDTVTISMQCIDKNVTTYYTTLALIADDGPGGGTSPNNPPTNITNGALGIFSAHTIETKSVIIK